MAKISKELQDTLRANTHIEKVYFDVEGNHYFNAHKHPTTSDLYSKYISHEAIDRKTGVREKVIDCKDTDKIAEVIPREEVLAAKAWDESITKEDALARIAELEKQLADKAKPVDKPKSAKKDDKVSE